MKAFNRRQWLKAAGISGAASLLGNVYGTPEPLPYPARPLANPIGLNANENPYGPSPNVRKAITEAFDQACRYPFAYLKPLVNDIAKKEGVSPDHIVITGGSTEGLKITGLTYGIHGGEIIAADPTFQSMLSYAGNFGAHINRVPLDEDLQHDLEEMDRRINNQTRLIFMCNPNNPTGTLLPSDKFSDFCDTASNRVLVFSDEAYRDFIDESNYPSMVELVKKGKNVIVSRTFSKVYGLAGIRIGYLIARPDIAQRLLKNVVANTNVLAIKAARTALADKEFYQFALQKNREAKALIYQTLDELELEYHKSHTNFVFFKSGRDIRALNKTFMDEGIKIGRPFPPLNDWCRISTGTVEEVGIFCKTLKKVMG